MVYVTLDPVQEFVPGDSVKVAMGGALTVKENGVPALLTHPLAFFTVKVPE